MKGKALRDSSLRIESKDKKLAGITVYPMDYDTPDVLFKMLNERYPNGWRVGGYIGIPSQIITNDSLDKIWVWADVMNGLTGRNHRKAVYNYLVEGWFKGSDIDESAYAQEIIKSYCGEIEDMFSVKCRKLQIYRAIDDALDYDKLRAFATGYAIINGSIYKIDKNNHLDYNIKV